MLINENQVNVMINQCEHQSFIHLDRNSRKHVCEYKKNKYFVCGYLMSYIVNYQAYWIELWWTGCWRWWMSVVLCVDVMVLKRVFVITFYFVWMAVNKKGIKLRIVYLFNTNITFYCYTFMSFVYLYDWADWANFANDRE